MRPTLRRPHTPDLDRRLARLADLPVSYWERGVTQWTRPAPGYVRAEDSTVLGTGDEVWQRACTAIGSWGMYPDESWVKLYRDGSPRLGQNVMVQFRLAGLWWTSPCRIVYLVDEPDRRGFAYGTLPGHVERGEELFAVERDPVSGLVTYRILMIARAVHPLARLFPWVVRLMQERFRKTSLATMRAYVARGGTGGAAEPTTDRSDKRMILAGDDPV